jgi:hypothetical protein
LAGWPFSAGQNDLVGWPGLAVEHVEQQGICGRGSLAPPLHLTILQLTVIGG